MTRPLLLVVLLILLPSIVLAQGGLVAKHKHDGRRAPSPVTRLEAADHSFSLVVPYGWLLLTGDSKYANDTLAEIEKEPGTEDVVMKIKSGLYQIFATNLFDGFKEKAVGATFSVSVLPDTPFEFTEAGIEEFKSGFSANPRIKDVSIKTMDINGVAAYKILFKVQSGDNDLDSVAYAFRRKNRMFVISVSLAPGTLDVERYDKVARSIKFND